MKHVLVISDNELLTRTIQLLAARREEHFAFRQSSEVDFEAPTIIPKYNFDLIISAHCKVIFPPWLVKQVRCINIHPGLNPHNRGYYPQVFSILNGKPIGATIHEMVEKLDAGPIIDQMEIDCCHWDTSKTLYEKVQNAEVALLYKNFDGIVSGNYRTWFPETGNYNSLEDFKNQCALDLRQQTNMAEILRKLRALSHPPFNNAYYEDEETGERIYVEITCKRLGKIMSEDSVGND
jgi:methionyl-tRNA formyltransferase